MHRLPTIQKTMVASMQFFWSNKQTHTMICFYPSILWTGCTHNIVIMPAVWWLIFSFNLSPRHWGVPPQSSNQLATKCSELVQRCCRGPDRSRRRRGTVACGGGSRGRGERGGGVWCWTVSVERHILVLWGEEERRGTAIITPDTLQTGFTAVFSKSIFPLAVCYRNKRNLHVNCMEWWHLSCCTYPYLAQISLFPYNIKVSTISHFL